MTLMLDKFLEGLKGLCDKETYTSPYFGVEFGSSTPERIERTSIKGVLVTPNLNLKAIRHMVENKLNFALTSVPLPLFHNHHKLMDRDFELVKALVSNDFGTLRLPDEWLYAPNGAVPYFLQTLGYSNIKSKTLTYPFAEYMNAWKVQSLNFNDFTASLSHLTKSWSAIFSSEEASDIVLIYDETDITEYDLAYFKENEISTIVSFSLDSREFQKYKENKINFLFIPFIEFCNIALRKFAQLLQLETGIKVVFYPQESLSLLTSENS